MTTSRLKETLRIQSYWILIIGVALIISSPVLHYPITPLPSVYAAQVAPAAKAAPSPTAQPTQAEPARGRTIFDYKGDLNMTDKQEQDIRTILQNLNKDARLSNARLVIIDSELEDLLNKEGDLDLIRKKLREAADIRIVMRIADIEATRRINRTLSPEQLKRWRAIQAAAR